MQSVLDLIIYFHYVAQDSTTVLPKASLYELEWGYAVI